MQSYFYFRMSKKETKLIFMKLNFPLFNRPFMLGLHATKKAPLINNLYYNVHTHIYIYTYIYIIFN